VIPVEFQKQLFRIRTYLALGLMMAIPTIFTLAFKFGGGPHDRHDRNFFELATQSGLNMPLAALSAMTSFLLPVVVAIFAGCAIAEESSWGTLRYLLLRPVSRSRVLVSKLIVAAALTLLATTLIVVAGIIGGVAAFGWHDVITPSFAVLSPSVALQRLALATIYVAWSMAGILAIGFLVSVVADAVIGAVASVVGVAIVSQILDAIPPMQHIRSILPTHYWHAWESMYSNSISYDHIIRGTMLQLPYVIICLAIAWWWFHRKDIVT
jgi:ABC-2 type transport system permease protein